MTTRTFGKLTIVLLIFGLVSCAKPNYQDEKSKTGFENQPNPAPGQQQPTPGQANLSLDMTWEKIPTETEEGSFFVSIYEKENPGAPLSPNLAVEVVLWMPDMGHGSSPVRIEKVSFSRFRVLDVFFIMPGIWEIRFKLKDGADVIGTAVRKITI